MQDIGLKVLIVGSIGGLIGLIAYAIWLERQPPIITPAGQNCVIVEQGGFKQVRCFTNTNINVVEGENVED